LECVASRRRITIQPPPSGLAKNYILKPYMPTAKTSVKQSSGDTSVIAVRGEDRRVTGILVFCVGRYRGRRRKIEVSALFRASVLLPLAGLWCPGSSPPWKAHSLSAVSVPLVPLSTVSAFPKAAFSKSTRLDPASRGLCRKWTMQPGRSLQTSTQCWQRLICDLKTLTVSVILPK
jgi:hypothetical protein